MTDLLPLLLPLLLMMLLVLLAAGDTNKVYYCDSSRTVYVRGSSFTIVTRNAYDWNYWINMQCRYTTNDVGFYFLEFEEADAATATLSVYVGNHLRFKGTGIDFKAELRSMFLTSGSLTVQFDSSNDYSRRRGFQLRVTRVSQCPPGWSEISGSCYGTARLATSSRLNYTRAQAACISMRSNLLQPPDNLPGGVHSLREFLRIHTQDAFKGAWIGVTDRQKQYQPKWLSGESFAQSYYMKCNSKDYSYRSCGIKNRCAAFDNYATMETKLTMDLCSATRKYLCWMPPLGSTDEYQVPDVDQNDAGYSFGNVVFSVVIFTTVGIVVVAFIVAVLKLFAKSARHSLTRRRREAEAAESASSRPTAELPPYSVAVGMPRPQQQQAEPSEEETPPTYAEAVRGIDNEAFKY